MMCSNVSSNRRHHDAPTAHSVARL
jgi:hypothetical protein